jgi:hypothetical protein
MNGNTKIKVLLGVLVLTLILGAGGIILASCEDSKNYLADKQRVESIRTRSEMFEKATSAAPEPIPENFLARQMLVKYVDRLDTPDKPCYIYLITEMGTCIGYYMAQAAPVNLNAFLSSTQSISNPYGDGNVVLDSPSLDGIFYGGAGSSQGGNNWFFFDSATDALIILYDQKIIASDQPLSIDADPITVLVNP